MSDKTFARDESIMQAREVLKGRYVVIDTETTGLKDPEVVQLAVVHQDTRVFSSLIKPVAPIDPGATLVHGFTNEQVADLPGIGTFWDMISVMIKTCTIIGYNVGYDIDAINRSLTRNGIADKVNKSDVFDVMLCWAAYVGEINPKFGTYRWHKLEEAMKACGITQDGELHDALLDAYVTLDVLKYIANQVTSWEYALLCAKDLRDEVVEKYGSNDYTEVFDLAYDRVTYKKGLPHGTPD